MTKETDRQIARRLFDAGVAAADPSAGVRHALQAFPPPSGTRLVLAVGKAAGRMAQAALEALGPDGFDQCLVVTNYENAAPLNGAEVMAAGHPVPDAGGEAAAQRVEAFLGALGEGDEVLALISGGGSALLPAPAPGLTLANKAAVSDLLLASGADIVVMNLIRQSLSRLKGGGLLRAAAPARVTALILSDVIGDDLRVIASGPSVAPIGTRADARAALRDLGLWDRLPDAVRAHLDADAPDAPPLPDARNILIGSNSLSLAAMGAAAPQAHVVEAPLIGDVRDAVRTIMTTADAPGLWLFGGETTVQIEGTGKGGRNQELALRLAQAAKRAGWQHFTFLSGGTDGRDGPTDAAGGLVDEGTLDRMGDAGLSLDAVLADNDAYHGLKATGDLLMTGATGTNVADLQVLIRR